MYAIASISTEAFRCFHFANRISDIPYINGLESEAFFVRIHIIVSGK